MRLYDVQAGMGGATPGSRAIPSPDELLNDMQHVGIGRALVRIAPETLDTDVTLSVAKLFELCAGHDELVPCPVVVPNTASDLPPEDEQIATALEHGAEAMVIRPGPDCWLIEPWCASSLFSALEARRMPTLCPLDFVTFQQVADIATRHPDLPLVIIRSDYRQQRILLPLLQAFPNTFLSMGTNYCVHAGLEQLLRDVGPERILFGTGWPRTEPASALTHLAYAPIDDTTKALIGGENMARLVGSIRK